MHIALDATYAAGEHLTGVGVYSRELLDELARLPEAAGTRWLWCFRSQRWRDAFRLALPPGCARRPLFERWTPRAGLFHGLNQRLPLHTRPRRTVATFHDLFVMTAEYSTPEFRRRFTQQARHAAAAADGIIAVSAFTASQVEALLGVDRARIRVVHHGVRPRPSVSTPAAPREPLILTVGAIQKRKNTLALVRAFERLALPGWRLVLAGAADGYGAAEVLAAIDASPLRDCIEVTGWIPDGRLNDLYARASLFAFPSLDEGFGMPVLEAMAAGVPVLASGTSALPEVCADAALLVDPGSGEAITEGLRRLMESTTLRKQLSRRGIERAARFSWEAAARQTWQVYRELAWSGVAQD